MGYRLLGFLVWRGGKWYLKRRFSGASRKLAIAGLAGTLIAAALIVGRQRRAPDD